MAGDEGRVDEDVAVDEDQEVGVGGRDRAVEDRRLLEAAVLVPDVAEAERGVGGGEGVDRGLVSGPEPSSAMQIESGSTVCRATDVRQSVRARGLL